MTRFLLALFLICAIFGQQTQPQTAAPGTNPDVLLPNGKSQREETLKVDHKKSLADAAVMAKLAEEVSEDLEKDDRYVVSLKTMKKLDEIERLAKAIKGRMKKF